MLNCPSHQDMRMYFSVIPEVKASYHWSEDGHDHDEFSDILSKSRIKKIIENCYVDGEYISC